MVHRSRSGWFLRWRALLLCAASFGLFIGLISLVNGRWLHVGTRPRTTTIGGALVGSLVIFAVLGLLGVIASGRMKRASAERMRRGRGTTFWLSGYATAESYECRCPDWNAGPTIGLQRAKEQASVWVSRLGGRAVVEIGSRSNRIERVVGLVTADGYEEV